MIRQRFALVKNVTRENFTLFSDLTPVARWRYYRKISASGRSDLSLLYYRWPYSGATAQTRSAALWGVSGSYGQAPAQQGMSGLVRKTSHLWLYSSPSPSLQPILREPATSILIVLYTFECIMWVATESLYRATSEFSNFIFIIFFAM